MHHIHHCSDLQIWREQRKCTHDRDSTTEIWAFIPTMGALHAGHMSLIQAAQDLQARTIVSLFVNPMQFDQSQDFTSYPRKLKQDLRQLRANKVDVVFTPSAEDLAISQQKSFVISPTLEQLLCGKKRVGHFQGVCTIVMKLFMLIQPQIAIFGEKDYQQLYIIRQMVRDFHLPIRIISKATQRETSGLAMSSRNLRLSPSAREHTAPMIYKSLRQCQTLYQKNKITLSEVTTIFQNSLPESCSVEYATVLTESLSSPSIMDHANTEKLYLHCAVFVEGIRLIDHICLSSTSS